MSDEREKLINVMRNLESDYKSGKISAEKYSYFRSKYEDKLNSIDARAATKRIRSMQGKPSNNTKKLNKRPTKNKKKEEQDLVQKYIINPKKSDAKYNKKKKPSMDSGTFKLLLILILVIGFTAGIAYGIFNLDFGSISDSEAVAIVSDTAFPEINEVLTVNTTTDYNNYSTDYNYSSSYDYGDVETTTDYSDDYSSDDNYDSNSYSETDQSSDSGSSDTYSDGGSNSESVSESET